MKNREYKGWTIVKVESYSPGPQGRGNLYGAFCIINGVKEKKYADTLKGVKERIDGHQQ